ncbi:MAG: hypothetical protein QOG53_3125 [Frankiales bacterium]|nr:hypothetical protein [Frankiales bacterium]
MDYQIVCVCVATSETGGHGHVVTVGIGTAGRFEDLLWVEEVYEAIERGHRFFTISRLTGQATQVFPSVCCGIDTLRTGMPAAGRHGLDDLPLCRDLPIT